LKFYFSLYIGGMCVLQGGLFLATIASSLQAADIAYRIAGSGALLFFVAFYPLVSALTVQPTQASPDSPRESFFGTKGRWDRKDGMPGRLNPGLLIVGSVGTVAGIITTSIFPYFSSLKMGKGGFYIPVIDPAVMYLGVPFVVAWAAGLARLIGTYRKSKSVFSRNRLLYPIIGSLALMIGVATNLTPLQDYPVDIVFFVIHAGLIAYVVTRYRVIDVRSVLVRGFVLVAIVGAVLLVDLGLTIVIDTLFFRLGIGARYWSSVLSFMLLAGSILLLQRRRSVRRALLLLFPSYGEPEIELEGLSATLLAVADVVEILDAALELILTRRNAAYGCAYISPAGAVPRIDRIKPKVCVHRDESGVFDRVSVSGDRSSDDSVNRLTPEQIGMVVRISDHAGGPFWLEEVKSRQEFGEHEWPDDDEITGLPEIAVPLYEQDMITGFLCIDGGTASRVVDERLLSLLRTVGGMTSVALSRVRAHDRLRIQLEENEVLLKEVHHRVKNNLQIIASYLSLESVRIVDPEVKDIFKEMRGRIQSLSLVHEILYGSESLKSIDVRVYVGDLMNVLLDQWSPGGRSGRGIEVVLEIDPVQMTLNTAIPFGLALNELVTNACKYAFVSPRPNDHRSISISLEAAGNRVHCEIADNGMGMPTGVEDEGSLGLRLVDALIRRQLEGTWEIDRSRGTRHVIEFELSDE